MTNGDNQPIWEKEVNDWNSTFCIDEVCSTNDWPLVANAATDLNAVKDSREGDTLLFRCYYPPGVAEM